MKNTLSEPLYWSILCAHRQLVVRVSGLLLPIAYKAKHQVQKKSPEDSDDEIKGMLIADTQEIERVGGEGLEERMAEKQKTTKASHTVLS